MNFVESNFFIAYFISSYLNNKQKFNNILKKEKKENLIFGSLIKTKYLSLFVQYIIYRSLKMPYNLYSNKNIHKKVIFNIRDLEPSNVPLLVFMHGILLSECCWSIFHLDMWNFVLTYGGSKRDFIIEKQLLRWVMKYTKCLSYSLLFYATQIISPFLKGSQPIIIKCRDFSPMLKSL